MLFVDNEHIYDPSVNLALEEYLLRNVQTDENILLFYINRPSIIIGRHQNTVEEINVPYVEEHNIQVVRRLSGGGAVYHDMGNLNFSFITEYHADKVQNFQEFTKPVIRALAELGVTAELSGRNDILVNGAKVSGNAQYISRNRMYSHGTLLFKSDLSHVADALKVKASKISSKGIKSVRSRVTNISEFMTLDMDIEAFRLHILRSVFNGADPIPSYTLSDDEWKQVYQLADERYRQWDWNFGQSPAYNLQKDQRFTGGEIDLRLNVEKGVIQGIKFYGDFFSQQEPGQLEQKLSGVPYRRDAIEAALQDVDTTSYFLGVTKEEFLDFLSTP